MPEPCQPSRTARWNSPSKDCRPPPPQNTVSAACHTQLPLMLSGRHRRVMNTSPVLAQHPGTPHRLAPMRDREEAGRGARYASCSTSLGTVTVAGEEPVNAVSAQGKQSAHEHLRDFRLVTLHGIPDAQERGHCHQATHRYDG